MAAFPGLIDGTRTTYDEAMIISSLRPAGLAAAVIASLAVHAAAQVKGPTAPAEVWTKIIAAVKRDGAMTEDPPFVQHSLTATIKTDPLTTVHDISIHLTAGEAAKRKLVGVEISITENSLILRSGTILTESWTFLFVRTGRLDTAVYKKRVDVAGSEPVSDPPVMMDLADPKTKAKLDEMLRFWSTR